jgi:glycosyltransferase involved in cell wall biosynthesis
VRVILVNTIAGWGGGESWTLGSALALRERGHSVSVIARDGGPLLARARAAGVAAVPGPVAPLAQLGPAGGRLRRWVAADPPAVMLAISGPDLRLIQRVAPRRSARVFRRGLDRPLRRDPYHRWLFRSVDAIVANSAATRRTVLESLPEFPPARVHTIYNPVDENGLLGHPGLRRDVRRELAIPETAFVVGVVGRLVPQKGHHVLLAALPRLVASRPDAVLLVVGGGALEPRFKEAASALGVAAHCRFAGHQDAVGPYYAACDAIAVPSFFEGFCYAAAEAALMALPVVASDVSSLPEVVLHGESGWLVPAGDPAAFADRLHALAEDPALARRFGERGRAMARERFAPPALHAQLESVLVAAARTRSERLGR